MMGIDIWSFPEEMEEEEKDQERQFRKNELVISRRLVGVVATNFAIWMPLIMVAILSLCGSQVSDVSIVIIPCSASVESGDIGTGLVHQSIRPSISPAVHPFVSLAISPSVSTPSCISP